MKNHPTIADLEARLAADEKVTSAQWAQARANDELAEAESVAAAELETRRAELSRQSQIDALLQAIDEPSDLAQDVLDARQEAQQAIDKLAQAVETFKDDWDKRGRALRRLNPGSNVIVASGERWSISTPNKTVSGFDKHLLAQLVAELTMAHFHWSNQPNALRALMGRQPHFRIQALERLAGTVERNIADWDDANPGEPVPETLMAALEAA